MGRVIEVATTSFTVADIDRSLAFYCGLLGLEESTMHPRGYRITSPFPSEADRPQWDPYLETLTGMRGARLKRLIYLNPPDKRSYLELLEFERPPDAAPLPRRRAFNEPGKAKMLMYVQDSIALVARLRAGGADVSADPTPYVQANGARTLNTYVHDPDDNALVLFEIVEPAPA